MIYRQLKSSALSCWTLFAEEGIRMKVILLFDQIQVGYGGKERPNTPLGLEKGGIDSYLMFKDVFAAS